MVCEANAEINQLASRIAKCRICLEEPEGKPLPHEPRPVLQLSSTARLCIAGQAPGTRVHESGRPFTDRSGDRLRDWMGIDVENFHNPAKLAIVPMGFCFPGNDKNGGDLPPRKECAKRWHDEIFQAMPQIELLLTIGLYAQNWHIARELRCKSLTETVRNWRAILESSKAPKILPLPHPSWRNTGWLKNNSWFESELLPVLKTEVRRLVQI